MATLFFSFGGLFQVSVLLVNSIAVLSEDRFLARIGWGAPGSAGNNPEPSFGAASTDATSAKAKMINLISSVRTLMRRLHPLVPLIFLNLLIIVWAIAFG